MHNASQDYTTRHSTTRRRMTQHNDTNAKPAQRVNVTARNKLTAQGYGRTFEIKELLEPKNI